MYERAEALAGVLTLLGHQLRGALDNINDAAYASQVLLTMSKDCLTVPGRWEALNAAGTCLLSRGSSSKSAWLLNAQITAMLGA